MEEKHDHGRCGLSLAMKAARLALQAVSVAMTFCLVKEVHKVNRAVRKQRCHQLG